MLMCALRGTIVFKHGLLAHMARELDLLSKALDWVDAGRSVAVATVIETWGSAPRAVGSLLIIDESGAMDGSVSGGCVEAAVVVEAQEAIEDGQLRVLEYGVSEEDAFAVGLACGGKIRIIVEPIGSSMPIDILRELITFGQSKTPIGYVVDLESGDRRLARVSEYPDRFRLDRSGIESDGANFVAIYNPPLRLIIVGAVHIAQYLVPMAASVGFTPIVIDPRGAFATTDRFPVTTLIEAWPDSAMKALAPDARTAIVTLSHDPKLDDPALLVGLQSDAFYIGCLGSKRTHEKRVQRLRDNDISASDIDRIHAPVGLNIGGRNPAEIAVSTIAQIVGVLRQKG
jgi:xanthine dehydrogenase accessory factor